MSDASSSGFGKFVPGFEFLQNLAGQAAGGVAQGMGSGLSQMPNLGNWVAPTFNVEDLEKRIQELKAVHFWLDQNAKALSATIQALEVQKMTLLTLKNMNFSLGDVANALKIPPTGMTAPSTAGAAPSAAAADAPARTQFAGLEIPPRTYGTPDVAPAEEAPDDEPEEELPEPPPQPRATPRSRKPSAGRTKTAAAAPASAGVVDPVQWWDALTQQFQQIAANAMKDVGHPAASDAARQAASGAAEKAQKAPAEAPSKAAKSTRVQAKPASQPKARTRAPARKKSAPTPAKRTAAPTQPLSTGDWPMPAAFFPLAGFGGAPTPPAPAKRAAAKTPVPAKKTPARKPAARKTAPTRSGRRTGR